MRLFFSILAGSALVLSACTPFGETSIDECTGEMPEIIAYAKDGTPIYSEVLGIIIVAPKDDSNNGGNYGGGGGNDCVTPPCDPTDPDDPSDPTTKDKCNCGIGNGPEGDPDCDPGNSPDHNQAGD